MLHKMDMGKLEVLSHIVFAVQEIREGSVNVELLSPLA